MPERDRTQPHEVFQKDAAEALYVAILTYRGVKELLDAGNLPDRQTRRQLKAKAMETANFLAFHSRYLHELGEHDDSASVRELSVLLVGAFTLLFYYADDPEYLTRLPLPTVERIDEAFYRDNAFAWISARLPSDKK